MANQTYSLADLSTAELRGMLRNPNVGDKTKSQVRRVLDQRSKAKKKNNK